MDHYSHAKLIAPLSVCEDQPPTELRRPPSDSKDKSKSSKPTSDRLEQLSQPPARTKPQMSAAKPPLGPHNPIVPGNQPTATASNKKPWNWQNPKAAPGSSKQNPEDKAKIVSEIEQHLDAKIEAMEQRLKESFESKLEEVLSKLSGKATQVSSPVQTGESLSEERDGKDESSGESSPDFNRRALIRVVDSARRKVEETEEDDAFIKLLQKNPRLLRQAKEWAVEEVNEPRGPGRRNHRRPYNVKNEDPYRLVRQMTITQTDSVVVAPRDPRDGVSMAAEGWLRSHQNPYTSHPAQPSRFHYEEDGYHKEPHHRPHRYHYEEEGPYRRENNHRRRPNHQPRVVDVSDDHLHQMDDRHRRPAKAKPMFDEKPFHERPGPPRAGRSRKVEAESSTQEPLTLGDWDGRYDHHIPIQVSDDDDDAFLSP